MTEKELDIMTDTATGSALKQAAIQDFCKAVRRHDRSIVSMHFDSAKDAVQVSYTRGSLWVDVEGKSIAEMLAAVLKEVA